MSNETQDGDQLKRRLLRIVNPTVETPAIFTNHMLIQKDEMMFYMSLYELIPPIIIPGVDEGDLPSEVRATPLTKLAIPLAKLDGIIEALQIMQSDTKAEGTT